MFMDIFWMVAGLTILTFGADWMVRSASALAIAMKISPLVVGLTVVAYGTGAPELVISLQALAQGQSDITVGNVIGSNLFNILATLGVAALITPLVVHAQLVRLDVPLLVIFSGLFWIFSADYSLGFWEGLLFTLSLVGYTMWVLIKSRQEGRQVQKEFEEEYADDFQEAGGVWWKQVLWLIVGLGMLVGGAQLFLISAVHVATQFGISQLVIGLTLVAGGTSLPELATTVVAAYRGERDIAVGNAIGSSLFNIMAVLGLSAMFAGGGLPVSRDAYDFDIPIMFAVSVACLPVFFIKPAINRWQGAVFFGYYLAYTGYLVMNAVHSNFLRTYEMAMIWFVIPLTAMAILIGLGRRAGLLFQGGTNENSHQPD